MATATQLLTLEEFRTRYAGLKPYYEYWNGEAIQKAMPTWLHGFTERKTADLLEEAGYQTSVEVELRIDPEWQPVPDVVGAIRVEQPYPTKPLEVIVEILSPEDRMSRVVEKCQEYSRIGIQKIFVIDPDHRGAFEWLQNTKQLGSIVDMVLPNGNIVDLKRLWERLDTQSQS